MARKTKPRTRRAFGGLRQLASGRWQANYTGPDLQIHKHPSGTFDTKARAEGWLAAERKLIDLGIWGSPGERAAEAAKQQAARFAPYAAECVRHRNLTPRTRLLYEALLRNHLNPVFGDVPLAEITAPLVRQWHTGLGTKYPTRNAHAYGLLHSILADAERDGLIDKNPCQIRSAQSSRRRREIVVLTPAELEKLAAEMPPGLALSVLLMGWCGFRRGEVFELRRRDVEIHAYGAEVFIERAVTYRDGEFHVGPPKTAGSVRTVAVPPHLVPQLVEQLDRCTAPGEAALLFRDPVTESHMREWSYRKLFDAATAAIGKPDLRVHDLRHCAGVLAALSGASMREVMGRLGHTTQHAALRYAHVAEGRDAVIAANLSKLRDTAE